MAISRHCGISAPHPPHDYYGPNPDPKAVGQVEYHCPGN